MTHARYISIYLNRYTHKHTLLDSQYEESPWLFSVQIFRLYKRRNILYCPNQLFVTSFVHFLYRAVKPYHTMHMAAEREPKQFSLGPSGWNLMDPWMALGEALGEPWEVRMPMGGSGM